MGKFDRTESAHTERKMNEESLLLQIGEVVKVFEHTTIGDNSNFEVNIILRDEDKERRRVPVMTPRGGEIAPPEKGDKALIGFLDGESEAPVMIGNMYSFGRRAPLGRAGMYRLRRGDLYVETHEDGQWARVAKKGSDDGTPSAKVELDDSGTDAVVNVEAEGDVIVKSSNGKVILGGDTGSEVARAGDPVEDSSGTQVGTIADGSENVDAA